MIITRTPFRISFLGGGTDYPAWYENHGPGAVLSATINRYCYITCNLSEPFSEYRYWLAYSELEKVSRLEDIRHPSAREVIRFLDICRQGLGVHYVADLPGRAGLGSSSSFTVGLLNAIHGLKGEATTKKQLAHEAIYIEQKMIGENVGSQDQTAAAFGGLNHIVFGDDDKIKVHPITASPARLDYFLSHLALFFINIPRNASEIAKEQIINIPDNEAQLRLMLQIVEEGTKILKSNENLDNFGRLLDEAWKIKRSLASNISTPVIDEIYNTAKEAGALGGKLLGAGGGGFMLFFVKPEFQKRVKQALANIVHTPFGFDSDGSKIIYSAP